jgi:oligoribonuclease NrnB/cAMP/cGMP phosphodiesterase (DHH superfamily)
MDGVKMEMGKKPLCIYHGFCDDGFGAAWALRKAMSPDAFEYYPGVYQQEPPEVTGRHVVLVDFSYKRPVLEKMAESARSILILDHHKTAEADLAGFGIQAKEPITYEPWISLLAAADNEGRAGPASKVGLVATVFDMSRSGAGIAWDFFNPLTPRPEFINYLEDRDLWRQKLPGGDQFTIALRSYPQDFKVWDRLARNVDDLIKEGHSIHRYYRLRVDELKRAAKVCQIVVYSDDWKAPRTVKCRIANAPYFAASEVAGELATDDVDFGACYFESEKGWQYSLRSRTDFDVSEVALAFGGGGHKAAAGFTVASPVHEAPF